MAQNPTKQGRLIRQRKSSPRKSLKKTGLKERSGRTGTFHLKARRDEIVRDKVLGRKGNLVCGGCGALYYDKHWHSRGVFGTRPSMSGLTKGKCDQCRSRLVSAPDRIVNFGGQVIVEGLRTAEDRSEISALVRNVGKRAVRRDPNDRIIRIVRRGERLTVFTTENQLAVSIGKQIDRARKGGKLVITWSSTDKPVRVRWTARK
ncbi:hypothetical protein AMJ57_02835 [Parcubacteria bacterium SG8_24]|nr:MAG: hypothetical protein AMJ57_02835 [Parcubacteria bacterium SG8_24]